MLIVCPSCATSYKVEPHSLGQEGRSVRCVRCQNVWFATPVSAVSTLPGSDDWDVVDAGPRVPSVDSPAETAPVAAAAPATPAEFATTEGIDVPGLSDEIATTRAEETEADAVLADVMRDEPAANPTLLAAAPGIEPGGETPASASGPDIESFAKRSAKRRAVRSGQWLRFRLSAALVALAAVNAGVIAWRADIVRLLPQTASLYAAVGLPVNLRGLAFENVRMSRVEQEGVGVMVVEGSIVNVTGKPVEVPRLRLALRNDAKSEIYAWTAQPGRSILAPGDALPFRSRLASPPADARDVQVRFFNRRDMMAGLN